MIKIVHCVERTDHTTNGLARIVYHISTQYNKKYKGLKNPDSVNMLYSFNLLMVLTGQLLCPECKVGSVVLHKQPIGIGVVGFSSVRTRYVIIVSLYLLTKIYCKFSTILFFQNWWRDVPG